MYNGSSVLSLCSGGRVPSFLPALTSVRPDSETPCVSISQRANAMSSFLQAFKNNRAA